MLDFDWFFREKGRRDLYVSDILLPARADDLIRLGHRRDGGYVVTRRMLDSADFLVTLGVGYDYSFEIDFARAAAKRPGAPDCLIHAYDGSVFEDGEIEALLKKARPKRFFSQMAARDYETLMLNKEFFSGRPARHMKRKAVARDAADGESAIEEICLQAVSASGKGKGLMVKMDIEGAEYEILDEMLARGLTEGVNALICEFHAVNRRHAEFRQAVAAIKEDFHLIHLHINNYAPGDALELSFERKSFGGGGSAASTAAASYPLPGLDYPNDPRGLDYSLLFREEDFFQGRGGAITAPEDAAPE